MSAAFKPIRSSHRSRSRQAMQSVQPLPQASKLAKFPSRLEVVASPQGLPRSKASAQALTATVKPFPKPRYPVWLKTLSLVQAGSSVVMLALVASSLVVYGWTVYTQQVWSRNYQRLESLQRKERELTAANEVLKNQIAQEAERPDAGLAIPNPGNTIFLQAPPPIPPAPPTPEPAAPPPSQTIPVYPLGY